MKAHTLPRPRAHAPSQSVQAYEIDFSSLMIRRRILQALSLPCDAPPPRPH